VYFDKKEDEKVENLHICIRVVCIFVENVEDE
jgi:hypothetical protein